MDNLLKDLEAVALLAEKATPGKWSVEPEGDNEFGQPVFTIEIFDGTCPIVGSGQFYGDPHDANECAAAVNFIRTHHAEIAEALTDARRYRFLRDAEPEKAWDDAYRELGGCASAKHVDAAIDAAIDAQHNSAREGLK